MNRTTSPVPKVLITDDEKDLRWMLCVVMKNEGFHPLEAENGKAALKILRQGLVDVMLLDIKMPGMDGLEVLREVRHLDYKLPIIMVTGFGTIETAIEAGRHGANGFLTKPFKNDEVVLTIRMLLENRGPKRERRSVSQVLQGSSLQIQKVLAEINQVAPTDFTVIIGGETGVGKELVAHTIHRLSQRAAGPFVAVDCGSIPPTLIESELFGHEKGAFTGADRVRPGSFESACGGTLFLDEIGNLPLPMQSKLLRAIQERQVCRVGSTNAIKLDVRVLAATNDDLAGMVESGRFRRDLFYRLNEFNIVVPPLRDRSEDIVFLAREFLEETSKELNKDVCEISETATTILLAYQWPGNIRELRNVIRRAVLLANRHIDPEHLSMAGMAPQVAMPVPEQVAEFNCNISFKQIVHQRVVQTERELLLRALKQTGGNMAKAARFLHIDYKTIRMKTKQYQLLVDD